MIQVVPIHVINLDRGPDRMGQMAATLDALGLSYTRIPACDGKTAEADTLDRVIAARGPLGAM